MEYINENMKLIEILKKYPETQDIFIQNGIKNLDDEKTLKYLGNLSLKNLLMTKKINTAVFLEILNNYIDENKKNIELGKQKLKKSNIKMLGLLPCPIRTPLLNKINEFLNENQDIKVDYELRAASVGLDWIKEDILKNENIDNLADIFISAGFDLFFEDDKFGKFKNKKLFKDLSSVEHYNKDFENTSINLKDPKNDYSMLGVVPAIFLVNKDMLGDRKMPTSWKDILDPSFKNSVSLPISDFDLFNSILIHINQKYGEEAIKSLGKSLLQNLHPAQMVKSDKFKENVPTITIMPYFFSKMLKENSPMVAIWPSDGAIISPIFMLTKDKNNEDIKKIAKFLAGEEIGEIMSHIGLFPTVNPNINNHLNGKKFMWCGWDYIYNNDIGKILRENKKIFFDASKER